MQTQLTKNNVNRSMVTAGVQIAAGVLAFFAFAAGAIVETVRAFAAGEMSFWPILLLFTGAFIVGFTLYHGIRSFTLVYRYHKLVKLLRNDETVSLQYLADKLGQTTGTLQKDFRLMKKRGFFPSEVSVDAAAQVLRLRPEKKPERVNTGDSDLDEMLTVGMDYMNRLMELDRQITSPALDKQVEQMTVISSEIFAEVRKNSRKVRQIRQFMNYYLPTTLKLLEEYVDFERQATKGENVLESMRKIEGIMDQIVLAFKRELDNLYFDKAIDISADIEVMRAMIDGEMGGKSIG